MSHAYVVNVTPIEQRRITINSKIGPTTDRKQFRFFSRPLLLPVVSMSIHDLVYRMRNGRTRTAQSKYARDNNKDADFFLAGQENPSAQRVQHSLLLDLVNTKNGGVLEDVLRKDGIQNEPLLITREAIVVNGNRRLATMRELLVENPPFSSFDSLECLVLEEGISEADIREIELRLQGARETKLDYDWIDEALLARDSIGDGKSKQQVADAMNMQIKDLDIVLRKLAEAEIYVQTYHRGENDEPGSLDILRDSKGAEQQFIELEKVVTKAAPEHQVHIRAIHHVLTANPAEAGGGRKYDYREAFQAANISTVLERVAKRAQLVSTKPSIREADPWDPEDTGRSGELEVASQWLRDRNNSKEKATLLRSVTQELIDEKDDKDRETRALRRISDALNSLRSADLASAASRTFDEMVDMLSQIESIASKLLSDINGRETG